MENKTRRNQECFYKELLEKYKGTTMAVSSESLAHKKSRFKHITDIFESDDNISIHDVGMGLADMYTYIQENFPQKKITYSGSEILIEFVNEASQRFPNLSFYHRDLAEKPFDDCYDYLLMSGVFHQRRENTIREWEEFAQNLIFNSFQMCKKGIAFNFISPFVDYYQTQVYYSNLPKIVNFINDKLSRFFVIKHNYALYEYTVYVYREEYIKLLHPEPEFQKYFKV